MIGGYEEREGASLYLIDYLASMIKVPFTTNGYGGLVTLSILDRYYKPGKKFLLLNDRFRCYLRTAKSVNCQYKFSSFTTSHWPQRYLQKGFKNSLTYIWRIYMVFPFHWLNYIPFFFRIPAELAVI